MPDQRALLDQINDLYRLAVDHGLYDAADWIKTFAQPKGVIVADLGLTEAQRHALRDWLRTEKKWKRGNGPSSHSGGWAFHEWMVENGYRLMPNADDVFEADLRWLALGQEGSDAETDG